MNTLELIGVNKKYGKNKILQEFSFCFEQGKCYAILGSNGTGKSTLIKGILGLINFNSGQVINNISHNIGYVPERIIFPEFITVHDLLYTIGVIKKIDKEKLEKLVVRYCDEWGMKDAINKQMRALSKGMHQKIVIIQAILTSPDVLILDEGLNGLDSQTQDKVINLIEYMKSCNRTVILTTHFKQKYKRVLDVVINLEHYA
jgi:ABC-type multidrug transport system ATPase subunit